jgi:hypothetical protein
MRHRHRYFGQNDGAPLHWRYNLSSLDPTHSDARMLSGLSQKCVTAASETFHFGVPRIGEKFSARKRSVITAAVCDQRGADNRADWKHSEQKRATNPSHSFRDA